MNLSSNNTGSSVGGSAGLGAHDVSAAEYLNLMCGWSGAMAKSTLSVISYLSACPTTQSIYLHKMARVVRKHRNRNHFTLQCLINMHK